eukprot:GHVN01012938.1.p1 GENE.GHVN01012938.1~~GHVN01012938.1.p1  ORF type:complete len:109 (-),score=3.42 GHVN01012938.1:119-445(-)
MNENRRRCADFIKECFLSVKWSVGHSLETTSCKQFWGGMVSGKTFICAGFNVSDMFTFPPANREVVLIHYVRLCCLCGWSALVGLATNTRTTAEPNAIWKELNPRALA